MKFKTKHCVLILVILSVIFLNEIFLHPTHVFQGRDHKDAFLYLYNYRHESFQKYDQFPLWDTHKYSGMYPDINTPHFYPFDFIFLFFFKDQFLNFFIFLHILLAGIFTYFFCRSLNFKEFPALISAIIFMFSGRMITLIGTSISQLATASLTPLSFWMFYLLIKKKKSIYVILLGSVTGLQLLSGEPQYFYISCLGLGLFFIFHLFLLRKEPKKIVNLSFLFIVAVILGLALSSIYLLPSLQFTQHLSRIDSNILEGSNYEYATSAGSIPPQQLITVLTPFLFGNGWQGVYWGAPEQSELYFYIGLFPLILVALSIIFIKNDKGKSSWFFLGLAIFTLLYSMGRYTPFFYVLFKILPGVGLFRIPSKMMVLYSLSLAVLSGFGLNYLLDQKKRFKNRFNLITKILFIILIISLVALIGVLFFKPQIIAFGEHQLNTMYYQTYADSVFVKTHLFESLMNLIGTAYDLVLKSVISFTILVLLSTTLFYLYTKRKISSTIFKILLIIILFIDVASYGIGIHNSIFDSQDKLIQNKEVLEFLQKDSSFYRTFITDQDIFSQYASEKYGIHQFLGIGSSRFKYYDKFLSDGINIVDDTYSKVKWGTLNVPSNLTNHTYSAKLLGMMNVKYLVSKDKINDKNYVLENKINNIYIYKNKKFLPRAFVVSEAKFSQDQDLILDKLKKDSFDPKESIIIEKKIDIKDSDKKQDFKEADISYYSPNKIMINIKTEAPSFLVLSDVWYPEWEAYDNEKKVEIYKTNYVIRSIYLNEGVHNVEFVYNSRYLNIGKIILGVTISFIILFLLYYYIKHRLLIH